MFVGGLLPVPSLPLRNGLSAEPLRLCVQGSALLKLLNVASHKGVITSLVYRDKLYIVAFLFDLSQMKQIFD